jgi:peptidoglycan/xylan/chitin deacetylase (PgdA/CDA1 family)
MRKTKPLHFCSLATILLVGLISFLGCHRNIIEEKKINVVFRYDDYSTLSSTDLELRIIDVFRRNEASLTFAVIPFSCTGDVHNPSPQDVIPLVSIKGDILRTALQDRTIDVAMHGSSHQTNSPLNLTEFSGLDYAVQLGRLTKAKDFLETMIDAPVSTFVPPWNDYDLNTLKALEELKFSMISGSMQGQVMNRSKLKFLPATCDLDQLQDEVGGARRSSEPRPVIVVLFHGYDFREVDEKRGTIIYQEFLDLLKWLWSQKDVKLMSITQVAREISDLSGNRFLSNKSIHSALNLLPSFVRKGQRNQYVSSARGLWLYVALFYLAIAVIFLGMFFVASCTLFQQSPLILHIGRYAVTVLFAIITIYAIHNAAISIKGMTAIAGAAGASVGTWLCSISNKKNGLSARAGKGVANRS